LPREWNTQEDAIVGPARQWLFRNRPASTEDAAFRLMGLIWADAPPDEVRAAAGDLIAMQKPGGGWPQLPAYAPDAYSSGEALYALQQVQPPPNAPAIRKGIRFLLSQQAKDGTWRVRTRMLSPAEVSPPYFTTGFPYGKDEYLSYAGTCWAVAALAGAVNDAPGRRELVSGSAADAPEWMTAALFGTPSQLAALLDRGLDPNSRTANGTTVLMAAAADAEKVRLLLARGADARSRTPSGGDALTVAAAYRGTARSLQALLDAGADPEPPEGVRVRNAPLVLAAMNGDLDNVRLLLARGAKASESALGEAVTFGYADVVRTLIGAGANARMEESSGINLLHWATITNRRAVIPVLAEAGVPIDTLDDNGFTPLMYAATLDFGDTAVLEALLAAGANRTVRNFEGRTPLAQARRHKHARLAELLR
jgi:ankyrin repeat protein